MQRIKRFLRDEEGVTAIEYGLIGVLIAVAVVTAVGLAGDALVSFWDAIQSELQSAAS